MPRARTARLGSARASVRRRCRPGGRMPGWLCNALAIATNRVPLQRIHLCNTVTQPICWLAHQQHPLRWCIAATGFCRCSSTRHESWQVTAHDAAGQSPRGRLPAQASGGATVTVRLLTNIGRLWTGSEVWSNAAILTQDDRIAWVGPASELPSQPARRDRGHRRRRSRREPRRRPGHAGPDRRAHAPGLRRATGGPSWRCGRAARRRPRSPRPAAAWPSTVTVTRGTDPWTLCNGVRERLRDVAAQRHHHDRGQDRLPPDQGRRAGRRPAAALAGGRAGHAAGARDVPGRERGAAGVLRPPPRLRRRGRHAGARTRPRPARTAWTCTAMRAGSPSARRAGSSAPGRAAGLLPRLHACGGDRAPARPGWPPSSAAHRPTCCTSADDEDVAALATRGRGRGGLPGDRARRHGSSPPVRALLDKGVPVALGSDHSPGGNGITSMPLVISAGHRATSG